MQTPQPKRACLFELVPRFCGVKGNKRDIRQFWASERRHPQIYLGPPVGIAWLGDAGTKLIKLDEAGTVHAWVFLLSAHVFFSFFLRTAGSLLGDSSLISDPHFPYCVQTIFNMLFLSINI